jgi:hypothetical protein
LQSFFRKAAFDLRVEPAQEFSRGLSQCLALKTETLFFLNTMMGLFFSVKACQLISRQFSFVFVSAT